MWTLSRTRHFRILRCCRSVGSYRSLTRMSLQGQSRYFEDLNETRRPLGGHPSSTTSRLNLMRLRAVLAPDPRFAVRRGRIFAPSRRYRSRHRSASPRSMPCAASPCFGLSARMGPLIDGQFEHAEWEGLRFYDLIFPLFIFVTGVAIVFSLMRLIEQESKSTAYWRVLARPLLFLGLGLVSG